MTLTFLGGTAAAVPKPFRPGKPALCGSHPLVTPHQSRLGDLLCFVFMYDYCAFLLIVYSVCAFSTLILLLGSFDL